MTANGGGGGRRAQRDNANGVPTGGPRGGGGGRSPEAEALTETLKNDNASTDEIKVKLAALREQRKKSAAELTQAREDLKKVLNMRQEASLVAWASSTKPRCLTEGGRRLPRDAVHLVGCFHANFSCSLRFTG